MIKVKGTVRPRALIIAAAVANRAEELRLPDMLITSGNDGKHMTGSKHYTGDALDIRSKHLDDTQLASLIIGVRRRLGNLYQVIVEQRGDPNEHVHIEYDPS